MVKAPEKKKRRRRLPTKMSAELAAEPMHHYAEDVVSGKIVACENIIKACERHLRDCERTDIYWDGEEARRVEEFFRTHLRVAAGDGSGAVPFELLPWQQFWLFSLFCWKMAKSRKRDKLEREPGTRRFRRSYLGGPKGNGKTPMVAGALTYLFVTGEDFDNEIFICGETEDQAGIPMGEIIRYCDYMAREGNLGGFYEANELSARKKVKPSSVVWRKSGMLEFYDRDRIHRGNIRLISPGQRGGGLSGLRVSAALVTELHEFSSHKALMMLSMSTKGKLEPLILIDTNTGAKKEGPCWDEELTAIAALTSKPGEPGDDYLALIYGVDKEDTPFKDRKCWPKANPSLGAPFMKAANIIPQINAANTPTKRAFVERLHFGRWPDEFLLPFDSMLWEAAQVDRVDPPKGASLFGGLDLAQNGAMAALSKVWAYRPEGAPTTDTRFYVKLHYWWCQHGLNRMSEDMQARLIEWIADKRRLIDVAPEGAIDYEAIATAIVGVHKSLKGFAYDPYKWHEILKRLGDANVRSHDALAKKKRSRAGIPLFKHPQGSQQYATNPLWIGGSYEAFAQALAEHRVEVENNPILTWNTSCGCLAFDKLENPYFTRPTGDNLIDGLVSMVMGFGVADYVTNPPGKVSEGGFG